MKKQYTQPELYIENVVVENGIAASVQWGEQGAAGQAGYFEDYGEEL